MQEYEILQVMPHIQQYRQKHESDIKLLETYVPMDAVIIRRFEGLIGLLNSQNCDDVSRALNKLQGYRIFKHQRVPQTIDLFDVVFCEEVLDELVKEFVLKAQEQQSKSKYELLKELQQQRTCSEDLFKIIKDLLDLLFKTSIVAADKSRLFARKSRQGFQDTVTIISEITGKDSRLDLNPKRAANQKNNGVLIEIMDRYKEKFKETERS